LEPVESSFILNSARPKNRLIEFLVEKMENRCRRKILLTIKNETTATKNEAIYFVRPLAGSS
jgi:hypothetical protein